MSNKSNDNVVQELEMGPVGQDANAGAGAGARTEEYKSTKNPMTSNLIVLQAKVVAARKLLSAVNELQSETEVTPERRSKMFVKERSILAKLQSYIDVMYLQEQHNLKIVFESEKLSTETEFPLWNKTATEVNEIITKIEDSAKFDSMEEKKMTMGTSVTTGSNPAAATGVNLFPAVAGIMLTFVVMGMVFIYVLPSGTQQGTAQNGRPGAFDDAYYNYYNNNYGYYNYYYDYYARSSYSYSPSYSYYSYDYTYESYPYSSSSSSYSSSWSKWNPWSSSSSSSYSYSSVSNSKSNSWTPWASYSSSYSSSPSSSSSRWKSWYSYSYSSASSSSSSSSSLSSSLSSPSDDKKGNKDKGAPSPAKPGSGTAGNKDTPPAKTVEKETS